LFLQQIKSVQPKGPYNIGGYSFGCIIGLEISLQLQQVDKAAVQRLIFLDGSHKYISSQMEEYRSNSSGTVEDTEAMCLCTFLMQFMPFEFVKVRVEVL